MSFIPVSKPSIGALEADYVAQAVESTWISSTGPFLDRFERDFADFCSVPHALGVANGTVALHLALSALEVGVGDEVIVPSLTYIATANAVRYCGAEPVFADVQPSDWGLDPCRVRELITGRTKAIVAVHLYGQPANMTALRALADEHDLYLVEDAAEAPGASVDGVPTGGLAHVGTFSFYGNKVISSGEGGAVTTHVDRLFHRMRLLRGQGMDPERRYWFPVMGFNYRLTNVAAALLCAQLERFPELLKERRRVVSAYTRALSGSPELEFMQSIPGRDVSPWMFCVLARGIDRSQRDEIIATMAVQGVDSRPFFIPLHEMPPHRAARRGDLPVTLDLANRGFNLPTFPELEEADIERVAEVFINTLTRVRRG